MLVAAKREDPSKLQSMIRETEIPNYESWFTTNFGQEKGQSWADPYGRWLEKNEKEFQELLVQLAQMDGEFAIEKMDSTKRYDLLNGPLDGYLASWKRPTAPKDEQLVKLGDFFLLKGNSDGTAPRGISPSKSRIPPHSCLPNSQNGSRLNTLRRRDRKRFRGQWS